MDKALGHRCSYIAKSKSKKRNFLNLINFQEKSEEGKTYMKSILRKPRFENPRPRKPRLRKPRFNKKQKWKKESY